MFLKHTMLFQSPGSKLRAKMGCPSVKLHIDRVELLGNPIILDTQTLDVILGMVWLSKHKVILYCGRKAVTVENARGVKVEFQATALRVGHLMINSLKTIALEDVPIAREYQIFFFQKICLGCHQLETSNSSLT